MVSFVNHNVVALRAGQGTRTSAKAIKRLPDERQIGAAGLSERNTTGLTALAAVAIFGLRIDVIRMLGLSALTGVIISNFV